MDLQEVGCGGCGPDRAGSGKGKVAGTCECSNEASGSINSGNFLTSLKPVSFSNRALHTMELVSIDLFFKF
jgi:hypothetical protein